MMSMFLRSGMRSTADGLSRSAAHPTERIGPPVLAGNSAPRRTSGAGRIARCRVRRLLVLACVAFQARSKLVETSDQSPGRLLPGEYGRSRERQAGQLIAMRGRFEDHSDRTGDRADIGRLEVNARLADRPPAESPPGSK